MKNNDFAHSVQKFFDVHLSLHHSRSENTVKSYRDVFRTFLRFMLEKKSITADKVTLAHLTSDVINEYRMFLSKTRKNSDSTINQRLSAIHSFVKFLQLEYPERILQWQRILTVPLFRQEKKTVEYLPEDDLAKLIASIKTDSLYGIRDRALLFVLYDTGARVQEIANLKLGDVRLEKPTQIVLHGKGKKVRIAPLQNEATKWLKVYMDRFGLTHEMEVNQPLFRNRRGKKFSRFGIAYLLEKYSNGIIELKSKKLTPHQLRHSKAMHMLKSGISSEVIQKFLGHADIKSTAIYAHADTDMVRSALEKLEKKKSTAESEPPPTNEVSWKKDPDLLDWLNNL